MSLSNQRVSFPSPLPLSVLIKICGGVCIFPTIEDLGTIYLTGLSTDSRCTQPGDLFIAIQGARQDGKTFIPEAIQKGAIAILGERLSPMVLFDPPLYWIEVKDDYHAWGNLAEFAYQYPLKKLTSFAVTGTNGKTTTSTLLYHILHQSGRKVGLISTVRYCTPCQSYPGEQTTPMPSLLQSLTSQVVQEGGDSIVMETSSHAITQKRFGSHQFDYAIFTNLRPEHLDFHGTMENYFQAKAKLFLEHLHNHSLACINGDDPYGQRLISELPKSRRVIWGLGKGYDVCTTILKNSLDGLVLRIEPIGVFESPLCGEFNAANLTAAACCAYYAGVSVEAIATVFANFKGVPGRLQLIKDPVHQRQFFVDYAHTPDALEEVLKTLRASTLGALWVLFGCGGNRDKTKRPVMGRIAETLADKVIITSDNPRYERPEEIIQDILKGLQHPRGEKVSIIPDRREAIQFVVQRAPSLSTILIAGKGHENYQEVQGVQYPFSDQQVVEQLLNLQDECNDK